MTQQDGKDIANKQSNFVVPVTGKGSNTKRVLYVGGLEENVNEDILKQAFIPFGEIKEVNMPLDNLTGKHRGFGFIEFEEKEEAGYAIDNMHLSELYGKILTVNYAQPMQIKGGDKGFSHQPVWNDMDRYLNQLEAEQGEQEEALGNDQPQDNQPSKQVKQSKKLKSKQANKQQEREKTAMDIAEEELQKT